MNYDYYSSILTETFPAVAQQESSTEDFVLRVSAVGATRFTKSQIRYIIERIFRDQKFEYDLYLTLDELSRVTNEVS